MIARRVLYRSLLECTTVLFLRFAVRVFTLIFRGEFRAHRTDCWMTHRPSQAPPLNSSALGTPTMRAVHNNNNIVMILPIMQNMLCSPTPGKTPNFSHGCKQNDNTQWPPIRVYTLVRERVSKSGARQRLKTPSVRSHYTNIIIVHNNGNSTTVAVGVTKPRDYCCNQNVGN